MKDGVHENKCTFKVYAEQALDVEELSPQGSIVACG